MYLESTVTGKPNIKSVQALNNLKVIMLPQSIDKSQETSIKLNETDSNPDTQKNFNENSYSLDSNLSIKPVLNSEIQIEIIIDQEYYIVDDNMLTPVQSYCKDSNELMVEDTNSNFNKADAFQNFSNDSILEQLNIPHSDPMNDSEETIVASVYSSCQESNDSLVDDENNNFNAIDKNQNVSNELLSKRLNSPYLDPTNSLEETGSLHEEHLGHTKNASVPFIHDLNCGSFLNPKNFENPKTYPKIRDNTSVIEELIEPLNLSMNSSHSSQKDLKTGWFLKFFFINKSAPSLKYLCFYSTDFSNKNHATGICPVLQPKSAAEQNSAATGQESFTTRNPVPNLSHGIINNFFTVKIAIFFHFNTISSIPLI